MLLYASKVIVFTLITLCAVNFFVKIFQPLIEVPYAGNDLLTQTMDAPLEKDGSIEFDPFTGKHDLIGIWCLQSS